MTLIRAKHFQPYLWNSAARASFNARDASSEQRKGESPGDETTCSVDAKQGRSARLAQPLSGEKHAQTAASFFTAEFHLYESVPARAPPSMPES